VRVRCLPSAAALSSGGTIDDWALAPAPMRGCSVNIIKTNGFEAGTALASGYYEMRGS
jgi:hypothetical protein